MAYDGVELAQSIILYMEDYDKETLFFTANHWRSSRAIMDAYDDTKRQLQGDGWVHVAWYLVKQLRPLEGEQELMAYDLLERLFSDHGIN